MILGKGHLGENFRPWEEEALARYLESRGHTVIRSQNIGTLITSIDEDRALCEALKAGATKSWVLYHDLVARVCHSQNAPARHTVLAEARRTSANVKIALRTLGEALAHA